MRSLSPGVTLFDRYRPWSLVVGALVGGLLLVAGCGDSGEPDVVASIAADESSDFDSDTTADPADEDAAATTDAVSADSEDTAASDPVDGADVSVDDSVDDSDVDSDVDSDGDDDGISVEDAERTDVLTGDYDMLLSGPDAVEEVDGCIRFAVTALNVGKEPDTYRIRSDVGEVDTGTEDPGAVTLDPGDEAAISVELCDSAVRSLSVQAFSDGLGGSLIDQLDLG